MALPYDGDAALNDGAVEAAASFGGSVDHVDDDCCCKLFAMVI